jgi:ABC-2 type transport system permease protein
VRGLLVAVSVAVVIFPILGLGRGASALGAGLRGAGLGVHGRAGAAGGDHSRRKFDQMAAITNFIVTPLAFLSGTFYSVEALPPC